MAVPDGRQLTTGPVLGAGGSDRRVPGRTRWERFWGPRPVLTTGDRLLWDRLLALRVIAVIVVAGVASVSDLPQSAPTLAVAMVLPYTGLFWMRFRRTGRLSVWMALGDQLLGAPFVFTGRAVYPIVILVLNTNAAFLAAAFGRRIATISIIGGIFAVGGASIAVHPEGWLPLYLLHVVALVVTVMLVGSVADSERGRTDRFEALLDGLDAIVWEGPDGPDAQLFVNERGRAVLGLADAHGLTRADWWDHVHPEDRDTGRTASERVVRGRGRDDVEYRLRTSDGTWIVVSERIRVTGDGLRGVVLDVTARREAEAKAAQFLNAIDKIPLALVVLRAVEASSGGRDLLIEAANPAALQLTGLPQGVFVGRFAGRFLPTGGEGFDVPALLAVLDTDHTRVYEEIEFSSRPGERYRIHAFAIAADRVAVSVEDITAQAQVAAELRRQALHDALTELPNRTLLADRVDQALSSAQRKAGRAALLLMDLDQFKEVNDALGHHQGDRLLVCVADRLRATLRDCDTIARLGGDEFAVLLRDVTPGGAAVVARRVLEALAEPFDLEGIAFQARASIGIALYPDHAGDAATLTRRADVAMYQAKRTGSGLRVYAPDDDVSSVVRLTMLGELRQALQREELVVHYQPVVDLRTGVADRVEALVRWQHPRLGLLLPGEFIELAELSGDIASLTRWVLGAAARDCGQWWRAGRRLGVGVNLSVRNLHDLTLVGSVTELVAGAGLSPGALSVEITESAVMEDPLAARAMVDDLKAHGVSVAIDDFGTGHSSLAYLRDLAIDEIKIDRGFVTDLGASDRNRTIVRAIVDLGHNLGLTVTAEGAEDEATVDWLRTLGCDRVQGFCLARPMPVPALFSWLDVRDGRVCVPTA